MLETLTSAPNTVLSGRVVDGISISAPAGNKAHSPFLAMPKGRRSGQKQTPPDDGNLSPKGKETLSRFARIYGSSYEGAYFKVRMTALFQVHEEGFAPFEIKVPAPDPVYGNSYEDLRAWSYDRRDESIRLDIVSGSRRLSVSSERHRDTRGLAECRGYLRAEFAMRRLSKGIGRDTRQRFRRNNIRLPLESILDLFKRSECYFSSSEEREHRFESNEVSDNRQGTKTRAEKGSVEIREPVFAKNHTQSLE